ncbi:hypothetical protein CCR95_08635 [Thiocystis minor]|uniref:hypothetical protein n=1 Tax=Thiocystis minor TaxID=61597 RepID=UPI001914AA87|nr:hypothetical protein [Thiocystis minor]MBK5964148.1 hypothetical protein [Thiocystis minor]
MTNLPGRFSRTYRADMTLGLFCVVGYDANYQRFVAIEKICGFKAADLAARDLLQQNRELKDARVETI